MDIIFHGKHGPEETADSLMSVLQLFRERYHIEQFREIHLTLTLVDQSGEDVELVDNQTDEVYRYFEIVEEHQALSTERSTRPMLRLVIDNTR